MIFRTRCDQQSSDCGRCCHANDLRSLGCAGGVTKRNRDSGAKERDLGPERGVWGWRASKRAGAGHRVGLAKPFGYWPKTRRPAGVSAGHHLRDTFRSEEHNWALQDSNLGPRDYESPALTAELRARVVVLQTLTSLFNTALPLFGSSSAETAPNQAIPAMRFIACR